MNDTLSFKNYICNKVSKNIGVIYRMSAFKHVLLNMYYTLAYPLLAYCNDVWGGAAAVHLK